MAVTCNSKLAQLSDQDFVHRNFARTMYPLGGGSHWSFIFLRKGHMGWWGFLENSGLTVKSCHFHLLPKRTEGFLKYMGNTKGASSPERGCGTKQGPGELSPSLPSSAHASFSGQLLPPGAPESQAPSLTTSRGKRNLFFSKGPWLQN